MSEQYCTVVKPVRGGWASWRDAYYDADVVNALESLGLRGWSFDDWIDGTIDFFHDGSVPIEDLVKLRDFFKPIEMSVFASQEAIDYVKNPLTIIVRMSWHKKPEID